MTTIASAGLGIPAIIATTLSATGAAVDNTFSKVQVYDPTQRRYRIQVEYGHVSSDEDNDLYPKNIITLEFREGQYQTSNGETGYGVVQATYEHYVQNYPEAIPVLKETIKTHKGE